MNNRRVTYRKLYIGIISVLTAVAAVSYAIELFTSRPLFSIPSFSVHYAVSFPFILLSVSSSGEKRIVDYTIESLEPLLDPKSFFRITRGCLASIGSIEKASRYFSGRLEIVLKDSTRLVLSRARVQDFLRWMDDK